MGWYGTFDMAGNVREWVSNALDVDRRFILGGAWKSPTYLYADPEALSPFDRSPENGLRTVRNIAPVPIEAHATGQAAWSAISRRTNPHPTKCSAPIARCTTIESRT